MYTNTLCHIQSPYIHTSGIEQKPQTQSWIPDEVIDVKVYRKSTQEVLQLSEELQVKSKSVSQIFKTMKRLKYISGNNGCFLILFSDQTFEILQKEVVNSLKYCTCTVFFVENLLLLLKDEQYTFYITFL